MLTTIVRWLPESRTSFTDNSENVLGCHISSSQYIYIYIYIYVCVCVCVCGLSIANYPEDLDSIPDQVIPKTQKMVLNATLLETQHYKVRIKSRWSNLGKEVAPLHTPWCSSYWKGSFRVAFENSQPSYLYIYIWICLIKD